ncbi:hypothetical protein L6452_35189 [Arctium lappa]|uniref:Uncharacterized protein n=1 Tax=Arctium lappa TaxID=4217 RepID=A0ACB8Y5U5_ARCLA|nr:hypothetical protein L6452_35189 [Arctium lappa]
MLARREIALRIKKGLPRRQGSGTSEHNPWSFVKPKGWRLSLRCLSAKYCPLMPSPRSTIAASFSPDGKILASTHGDHTVKIIDWQTGKCLKVLSGHRRTTWLMSTETESIVARLKSSGLFQTKGLIGGKWIDAYDERTIEVNNPASGDVTASVACMGERETKDAISSVYEAFRRMDLQVSPHHY